MLDVLKKVEIETESSDDDQSVLSKSDFLPKKMRMARKKKKTNPKKKTISKKEKVLRCHPDKKPKKKSRGPAKK